MPTFKNEILNIMDIKNEELIELILMKNVAYVWNSKDWLKLRSLRIMGNFIGNLTAFLGQDRLGGLPLALLKEETTLLLEKGFARLKTLPILLKCPDEIVQQKSEAERKRLFSEQVDILKERRKKQIESNIDVILKGKKAKNKLCQETEKNILENLNFEKEIILQEEFNKIKEPQKSTLAIQICTKDPWLEEKNDEEQSWDYPRGEEECFYYLIFKDLWEKGYYVTPGGKFGGDYLVYPGDPIKFHALFIIICKEKTSDVEMSDIITYGRLGQSVKKTVALAYLNKNNEVSYQSIQWDGI